MAIKEVEYSRRIIKNYARIPSFWKTSPRVLEAKIIKKFSLTNVDDLNENNVFLGYDGKIIYTFKILGRGSTLDSEFPSKKYEYLTKIEIKKSGSRKDIQNLLDLEQFLIKDGFEISK